MTTQMSYDDSERLLSTLTFDVQDAQSPLRHFRAKLMGIEPNPRQITRDGQTSMILTLKFKFTDVEVFKSVTPFPWKTAELSFNKSDSPTSAWGIFARSLMEILGAGVTITTVRGKMVEIMYTEGHNRRQQDPKSKQWVDTEVEAFEIG